MNPRRPPHQDPRPFSEVLRALAASGEEQLRVSEIVETFEERAMAAVMIFLGLLSLIPIPGLTTATGVPMILVSLQLVGGRETLWLPSRVAAVGVDRANFRAGVERALVWVERAERLTRPRYLWATEELGERFIGLVCLIMSCVLILPLWFGNFVPGVAVILLSLALLQRDGLFVLLGTLTAIGAFVVLFLVWGTIVTGLVKTWEWATGLF
jgi:hypothetical protein